MIGCPETRSPVPARTSGLDRAEVVHKQLIFTTASPEPEVNFAAVYIARRYGLALPLAQAVAALAQLGGRLA